MDGLRKQERAIGRVSRLAAWLAWSLCAVCVVVMVLTLLFQVLTPSGSQGWYSFFLYAPFAVFSVLLPAVGALVVSRHPRNPIGWLFCATGLVVVVGIFAEEYSAYAVVVHGGSLVG